MWRGRERGERGMREQGQGGKGREKRKKQQSEHLNKSHKLFSGLGQKKSDCSLCLVNN